MMRAGYTTAVLPFRNSDVQVRIRWYRANDGVPPLPFPSAISSLNWMQFPETKTGVGEVYDAPRPWSPGQPIPGARGDHVCGTAEDHGEGGLLDLAAPPMIYGAHGLPACCDPDPRRRGQGGTVTGGTAVVRLITPEMIGGTVTGGTAIVAVMPTEPIQGSGGTVTGGTAIVAVIPAGPVGVNRYRATGDQFFPSPYCLIRVAEGYWSGNLPQDQHTLLYQGTGTWLLDRQQGEQQVTSGWDGLSVRTFTPISGQSAITLTPAGC